MNMALKHTQVLEENSIDEILSQLRIAGWLAKNKKESEYAACLCALVVTLEIPTNIVSICESLPHKTHALDLTDILNVLSNLGYIGRPAKVKLVNLDERLLPCLFIPDETEIDVNDNTPYVVLKKNKEKKETYTVYDGKAENIESLVVSPLMSGTAYFFCKEEDVEQNISNATRSVSGFTWFRAILERFRGLFWQVFAVSVLINTVALAAPLFVMVVYDKVIGSHSYETLLPLTVGASLALISEVILRKLRLQSLAWFGARLDNIVSNRIFEQLILMPPIFTERASVASQIARLKAFESVRDFFTGSLFLALIEFPFTLIIIAAIAVIAGSVAIVPVIMAVLYVILLVWMKPKLTFALKHGAKVASDRQQMTFESFEKMHAIRTNGLTHIWFKQFRDLSGKASLMNFHASFVASIIETVAHSLYVMAGMLTVVMSIELVWAGQMTTGALVACMILVWRILAPFQTFCNSLPRFEQLNNAIDQVNRLMDIKTERVDREAGTMKGTHVDEIRGQVTFSKVGLRYTKNNDPVFSGLTFDAKPGQLIAITGVNGSGKSTILKLVNGMYKPQAGSIRIDGLDIRQLDNIDLRKRIGYVPQSPNFFRGTIAENLRFADPLACDEVIKVALNQVDAWDDVSMLSDGINTMIGKGASQLPASLAYRLNLARAYIKNTPLMLFDELPYSLLNSRAGDAFHETVTQWKGHRTIFMVTHREDYMEMADLVILLRSGRTPIVDTPAEIVKIIDRSNKDI